MVSMPVWPTDVLWSPWDKITVFILPRTVVPSQLTQHSDTTTTTNAHGLLPLPFLLLETPFPLLLTASPINALLLKTGQDVLMSQ